MGRSTFGQCTQPCSRYTETYYYRDPRYLSWPWMYYPRGFVSQKKEKKKKKKKKGKKEQAGRRTEEKETDKFWEQAWDKSRLSNRIDRSLKHEGSRNFSFLKNRAKISLTRSISAEKFVNAVHDANESSPLGKVS